MARIRTIKPEFFTSEVVASLPLRARLTWIGIWTHADDEGRCRDNAKLIKAAVYPLDDLPAADVEEDLDALADRGLIQRYEVEGKHYFHIPGWHEHQYINKPTPSRLPDPPGAGKTEIPGDPPETPGNAGGSPVGSGSGKEEKTLSPQAAADAQPPLLKIVPPDPLSRFPEFYAAYPKRVDRRRAEKSWVKLIKEKIDPQHMIDAATRYAEATKETEIKYIKHPATWLNAGSYDDQLEPKKKAKTFTDGYGNVMSATGW